jgi:hypothetical protein
VVATVARLLLLLLAPLASLTLLSPLHIVAVLLEDRLRAGTTEVSECLRWIEAMEARSDLQLPADLLGLAQRAVVDEVVVAEGLRLARRGPRIVHLQAKTKCQQATKS